MAREAVNDVRGTVHETYFGHPEKPQELGVPLSPTSQQVTQEQEAGPSPRGWERADAGDGQDRLRPVDGDRELLHPRRACAHGRARPVDPAEPAAHHRLPGSRVMLVGFMYPA